MTRTLCLFAAVSLTGCSNPSAQPPAAKQAAAAPAAPAAATPEAPKPPPLPPRPAAERKANNAEPGHCMAADLGLKSDAVIASVNGTDIKVSDLGDDYDKAEKKALAAYCTELDRLRGAAVRRAVEDKLLAAAAEGAGKDADSFLRDKVSGAVGTPTDAEVSAYYAKFANADAPPLEQVRAQVERAIVEENSKKVFADLMADLKSKAQIQKMLPDVRPPAQDVDIPTHAATFGPEEAVVQVVEFSDFECPYCAKAATAVSEVKKRYGDKVKFAFRHFPLSFHKNARPAAEYAVCANEQDKFWALHDEIFAKQKELSADSLRASAKTAGVDLAKLDECLKSGRPGQAIAEDMKKASEVGVEGTPSFYINGRPFQGGISADELGAAIDAELG
ncbi:MAG: thioredoxin domain-containing protein [Myxococcota bacterium]